MTDRHTDAASCLVAADLGVDGDDVAALLPLASGLYAAGSEEFEVAVAAVAQLDAGLGLVSACEVADNAETAADVEQIVEALDGSAPRVTRDPATDGVDALEYIVVRLQMMVPLSAAAPPRHQSAGLEYRVAQALPADCVSEPKNVLGSASNRFAPAEKAAGSGPHRHSAGFETVATVRTVCAAAVEGNTATGKFRRAMQKRRLPMNTAMA